MRRQVENKHDLTLIKLSCIQSIASLQSYGTYIEVKSEIERKTGIRLKVKGWQALFERIQGIHGAIKKNSEELSSLISQKNNWKSMGSFKKIKRQASYLFLFNSKLVAGHS